MLGRDAGLLCVLAEEKNQPVGSRRGTYLLTAGSAFCAVSFIKHIEVKQHSTSKATCLCVEFYRIFAKTSKPTTPVELVEQSLKF